MVLVRKAHECFHCKQWIPAGAEHDCWTTTEDALTKDLSEDLRDAWERLRETAVEFGEQRIYASHHSIMFARKTCYFFVRPKRSALEVVFFLDRKVRSPQIRKAAQGSRSRVYHVIHVVHRDQVEAPLTDWLRDAYRLQDAPPPLLKPRPAGKPGRKLSAKRPAPKRPATKQPRAKRRRPSS
jgi:hypothetical protein